MIHDMSQKIMVESFYFLSASYFVQSRSNVWLLHIYFIFVFANGILLFVLNFFQVLVGAKISKRWRFDIGKCVLSQKRFRTLQIILFFRNAPPCRSFQTWSQLEGRQMKTNISKSEQHNHKFLKILKEIVQHLYLWIFRGAYGDRWTTTLGSRAPRYVWKKVNSTNSNSRSGQ